MARGLPKSFKKSLWIFHINTGSCNGCDIEIVAALTPRYDLERFGIQLVGSIRHADVLLVTGMVGKKVVDRVKRLYEQVPKPCFIVAVGGCACSEGIFRDSYNACGPIDKILPVNAYIPGCPPKPEAIIMGIVKLVKALKGEK